MTQPTIVFSPLQAGVPAAGGALEVLVRVQAPDRPADLAVTHLPKRLALVVDRSGSMNGQPLQEALRCVTHIASHLTPQDALALVLSGKKTQPARNAAKYKTNASTDFSTCTATRLPSGRTSDCRKLAIMAVACSRSNLL